MCKEVVITKENFTNRGMYLCDYYTCPACKTPWVFEYSNFCPHCGVKLTWE